MIIVCQQCGQKLPKTAVMCPNCGSRQFAADGANVASQTPHINTVSQSTISSSYPQAASVATPNPSSWQSYTPNVYADSRANSGNQATNPPPLPTDVGQSTPTPPQNPYLSQQTYTSVPASAPVDDYQPQPNYAPQPAPSQYAAAANAANQLPSTALQTRKPAYTMLYAGFMRRGFAYAFDLALVSVLLGLAHQLLLPQILPQLGIRGFNDQTLALIAYGFYLFYMTLLTCLGRQATVGKVIMGMWVFGMQGQRVNFFHALIRETLKLILLPFVFLMWFTARKQTLHDLIARTVVLYDPS